MNSIRISTQPSMPQAIWGSQPPTHAQIATLAYEKYLENGSRRGYCERNWLDAERELKHPPVTPGKIRVSVDAALTTDGVGGFVAGDVLTAAERSVGRVAWRRATCAASTESMMPA